MNKIAAVFAILVAVLPFTSNAQTFSNVAVLAEPGFPPADVSAPSIQQLQTWFTGANFVGADKLSGALSADGTSLLVLPYGSAFPETAWESIQNYLQRGGNLLVLGGRPFTRAAYREGSNWKLREYSVRFTRPLMIDQYQSTPGSGGLQFQTNPEQVFQPASFSWKQAFSPVIRLSAVSLYNRGGSAGSLDARLDPLAWGVKNGRKLAAPLTLIDHIRNGFDGGRWIFLSADVGTDFYSGANTPALLRGLAELALNGSEEFTVRPVFPLYLPGEPVQLEIGWHSARSVAAPTAVRISTYPESQPNDRSTQTVTTATSQVLLPAPKTAGLHVIEAQLLDGNKVRAIYHSGFWIRDESYLRGGPRLSVNHDYFQLDGNPIAVVGTTYMSSEVQRLYFEHPNVYVWDHDLGQIQAAGLNMIRTGWWTGWDKFCDENGQPYERTLRTLEAYLMTARKYGLPVQFNFFAFLPDVLGGSNAYLDPEAVRKQRTLISAVVARFHDVPFLAWDLINEPSIGQHLWTMLPNGDPIELQKWNEWLGKRYPDRAALAAAWNLSASAVTGTVPMPQEAEFAPRGMYAGPNSLKVYDFFLFAEDVFDDWVRTMVTAIRRAGSQQLVTVGQDEGGIQDRLSPAFWGPLVSFTTNHSWWQNDSTLWDSIMAKQPGEVMLIQETGLQRELNLDETARRTQENEADLLERKIAVSFVQGGGAIEWLWNSNSYMTESNETPIGAVRPDGTEKPEATVLRAYGALAKTMGAYLRNPQQPSIAMITSQAAQFSVVQEMQLQAQRKAVRALAYYDHLPLYAIAENQIAKLGSPKLAILPSPQSLTDATWSALLKYVDNGGTLLVSGPVDRDEHWQKVDRLSPLKLAADTEPLTYHNAAIQLNGRTIQLTYDQNAQSWLEALRFGDGSTLKEILHGKGRIFWAAYPIELAQTAIPAAELYGYLANRLEISPDFVAQIPLAPGVLIYPIQLQDAVLYVMTSEAANDEKIDIRDRQSGVRLALTLPTQKAALVLIGTRQKAILAKYGF